MSSISIHSQDVKQVVRSITCTILSHVRDSDDIAEDLGFGRVSDYRLAVLEDDLVVAQITKSILPFLGRSDRLSVLALDHPRRPSSASVRRTPENSTAFKGRAGAMAEATSI